MRVVALAVFASLACSHPSATPDDAAPAGSASASATASPVPAVPSASASASAPVDAATDALARDDLAGYLTALPESGKSIGHTSVVFKLRLSGGLEAAYKPRSKRGHERYKGEIAAYRLGRALGLVNIPLALPRTFDITALKRALGAGSPAETLLADEGVADRKGALPGALIPWIAKLGFMPLERNGAEWKGWLSKGGEIPSDTASGTGTGKRELASDISTMIAFDYITGNWDRWSGGNIGVDPRTGRLLFIDNDGAFFDPPPPDPLRAMRQDLGSVARYSRDFILHLRSLDDSKLTAAFGDEELGRPLLSPRVVAGVSARLREVLRLVDERIASSSEPDVLFFP